MPLILYEGPEGAGKTALMTDELLYHYRCGGKIFAFPGYELLGSRGKVLSELLMPEGTASLINSEKSGFAIGIDEINNFFNHHQWQNIMNDILTSLMTQRRKRSFALLATVTAGRLISLDIRSMFHEVVHCMDAHAMRKTIPRGVKAYFTREDTRGLLSGRIGTRTPGKIFSHKRTWNHFNSFSPVDPKYLNYRVKMLKEQVLVDSRGNRVDTEGANQPQTQYNPLLKRGDKFLPIVREVAEIIRDKGQIATYAVQDMIRSQGIEITNEYLGRLLKKCGIGNDGQREPNYVSMETI